MKRYLWVMEVYEYGKWLPSVWVGLTRSAARRSQAKFAEISADQTRIVKYVSEPTAGSAGDASSTRG